MKKSHMLLAGALLAALSITGCSTSKDDMLPAGDGTMLDLWQNKASTRHTALDARQALRRDLSVGEAALVRPVEESYTRTAQSEISQQFPRLPNPDLVMYVFPHLTADGTLPVPGYSTVFPLYNRVQYALPGERVETL
ncbi:TIGR03751 family conjugal transfer lipoprotein [Serratia marcescens]|nr:TIGR03751 family conjugal transfer lipoprotein [Serratia marcescens]